MGQAVPDTISVTRTSRRVGSEASKPPRFFASDNVSIAVRHPDMGLKLTMLSVRDSIVKVTFDTSPSKQALNG